MPFTPFHFGPSATIAIPLRKYIDFPVFILANVVIDLEVLAIMVFNINAPLHGHIHSLTLGSLVAMGFAIIAYRMKPIFSKIMSMIRFPYETSFKKVMLSSLTGFWFHVLLDAPLYSDIKPFYPFDWNPFFGLVSAGHVYMGCAALFLPALMFYLFAIPTRNGVQKPEKEGAR